MFETATMHMTDEQREMCHAVIHGASACAAAIGAGVAQLPCSDSVPLLGIQVSMAIGLGEVFGVKLTKSVARGFIYSQAMKFVGRSVSQLLVGWLPGVGNAINAITASGLTEVIGWDLAQRFAHQTARAADGSAVRPFKQLASPQFGDVICVERTPLPGVMYDHYGVYEDDEHVYAFCTETGDFFGGEAAVRVVTLESFMAGDERLFVVGFPKRLRADGADVAEYDLKTPEETVRRARALLGETGYDLISNNCEHFAIWCKTDVHRSFQVDEYI